MDDRNRALSEIVRAMGGIGLVVIALFTAATWRDAEVSPDTA